MGFVSWFLDLTGTEQRPSSNSENAVLSHSIVMDHIPVEIWHHITDFLDEPLLWNVRDTSRLFLELALDRHYRNVVVNLEEMRMDSRCPSKFSKLGHPSIANRVRSLTFTGDTPCLRILHEKYPGFDPIGLILRCIRNTFVDGRQSTKRAISNLHSVGTLNVSWERHISLSSLDFGTPILETAFTNLSERLVSLSVESIPAATAFSLLTTRPYFASLQIASFSMLHLKGNARLSKDIEMIDGMIESFLSRHRRTISSAKFFSQVRTPHYSNESGVEPSLDDNDGEEEDMLSLRVHDFGDIPRFRRLFSLDGHQPHTVEVVRPHCPRLCDLIIELHNYTAQPSPSLLQFLQAQSPSLERLELPGRPLTFVEWSAFSSSHWLSIQHLQLQLSIVTPDIMDIFARDFPSLIVLNIDVGSFRRFPDSAFDGSEEFCLEMNRRLYPSASLRDLVISSDRSNSRCLAHVAQAFTGLRSFNSTTRSEYLAQVAKLDSPFPPTEDLGVFVDSDDEDDDS